MGINLGYSTGPGAYVLGTLALLILAVGASAELSIGPQVQDACCETVSYKVHISNTAPYNRVFTITAESEGIWVSLEPSVILIPGNSAEDLLMFARPECGAQGEYAIRVSAECGICEKMVETRTVSLSVNKSCIQKSPETGSIKTVPAEKPSSNATPEEVREPAAKAPSGRMDGITGAVVSRTWVLSAIIVLLIVIIAVSVLALAAGGRADR